MSRGIRIPPTQTRLVDQPNGSVTGQMTLTGELLILPCTTRSRKVSDRNSRLFHFFFDPSPVLTLGRARVIKTDGRMKLRLARELMEEITKQRRIELRHFGVIREEHTASIDGDKLRINLGSFYSRFYSSGEEVLVKKEGDRFILVTKVGDHPKPYMQFLFSTYRAPPPRRDVVVTTRNFIVPRAFYEQTEREFPSVIEVIGKAKRVREARKEKRYVSVGEDEAPST